ncbi:proline--tRNA ligase [Clostridiaceae bacterium M8S5]|nr:proline--tRNA ligase [Clostridiaceae bacterium M8S5]
MSARKEDFSKWYLKVIQDAGLSENSPVRGCMTMKPYGYAIWELIRDEFNKIIKEDGVKNCYFPLLIPMSYFAKEAEHVEGFAKEVAVVTHYRLKNNDGNLGIDENAKLEEPYVIRPTSETIIGEAMSRWIKSYRDLPLKLNQWANVMRWEMRTRPFLRTAEFLWQEGHNAFATEEESSENAKQVLRIYQNFVRDYLAMYSIGGTKTKEERFGGAKETYTFESMMQDGKSLQSGTSHDLSNNFAKAFNILYQNKDGKQELAYTTSWGITTRLIGAIIMSHSDDDGLILPPKIAPTQIIILPFIKKNTDNTLLLQKCDEIKQKLQSRGIRTEVDGDMDKRFSDKIWNSIRKGIPLRLELGERELEKEMITYVRRDLGKISKTTISIDEFIENSDSLLNEMQVDMYEKHKNFTNQNTKRCATLEECEKLFESGFIGFVELPLSETEKEEYDKVASTYKLTRRCMPFVDENFNLGESVIVAKSY